MCVIGTVGLPGSGKGAAADVARAAGVPVITMGDVIRDACRDRDLDPATHHGEVATALREEGGQAAIAERSLPLIREALSDHDTVLVDGLRSPAEADLFEAEFGTDFLLVCIDAPFEVRAERLADRDRDLTDADAEALRERERRELGFGMDEVMERADVTVENTGTLEEFRDEVTRLFEADREAVREGGAS